MALDPSSIFARTRAGDQELQKPMLGLSLTQRRLLTLLGTNTTLARLGSTQSLDVTRVERELARLSDLRLVQAIAGESARAETLPVPQGPPPDTANVTAGTGPRSTTGRAPSGGAPPRPNNGAPPGPSAPATHAPTMKAPPAPMLGAALAQAVVIGRPPRRHHGLAFLTGAAMLAAGALVWIALPTGREATRTIAESTGVPSATLAGAATGLSAAPVGGASGERSGTESGAGAVASASLAAATPTAAQAASRQGATAGASSPVGDTGPAVGAPTMTKVLQSRPVPAPDSATASLADKALNKFADRFADSTPERIVDRPTDNGVSPAPAVPPGPAGGATRSSPTTESRSAPDMTPSPNAPATEPLKLALAAPMPSSAQAPGPHPPLVPLLREAPEFPREALQANVERGNVKARLTIDKEGKVTQVDIIDAQPHRVFDKAVIRALSKWKYAADTASRSAEVEVAFDRNESRN